VLIEKISMLKIPQLLATELSLYSSQINNALELLAEGATVPFIARYRKERTGEMDETQLRELFDRYTYLTELEERKQAILGEIAKQGKLSPELQSQIEACLQKNELEDLYLPYRPKRRTRAAIAREKGLKPLTEWIKTLNRTNRTGIALDLEAKNYISEEKGVKTAEEALQGAADILAEEVADRAVYRAYLRDFLLKSGLLTSQVKQDYAEGSTKFEMYRNYQAQVKNIPPHNLLALYRGETEGILDVSLEFDEMVVLSYLEDREIQAGQPIKAFYQTMLKDAFQRLMKNSLISEIRATKKLQRSQIGYERVVYLGEQIEC
jgi:uncharacterized protein